MLGEPGVYYVRLDGGNFEEDATVTCSLLPPDRWEDTKGTGENNNYWKRAAAIPEGVANEYTLPARNDTDWFKITTNEPNQTVEIVLDIPVNGTVYCALWSGDDLWTLGDNASNLFYQYYESPYYYYQYYTSGVNTLRWMLGDAGDYYIRLYPYDDYSIIDSGATITYRLIEPDSNEGSL
ncbi:MAG: hypothetical protein IIZ23_06210, partial [Ruminococcus sp.]|nr:hypothetical protein [Ruminococcus sp.]